MRGWITCGARLAMAALATISGVAQPEAALREPAASEAADLAQLRQDFGEQQFVPDGGFLLRTGQPLPNLVWKDPTWIANHVGDAPITTRWFNERLDEVTEVETAGRYYVYGEASGPGGPVLQEAVTACSVGAEDLKRLAETLSPALQTESDASVRRKIFDNALSFWRSSEEGAVTLAALMDAGAAIEEPRVGQWQMENATRHVRLKRKLMGLEAAPLVDVKARALAGKPTPALRRGTFEEAGVTAEYINRLEASLDDWYASAQEPTAVVIARNGVIIMEKAYGELDTRPVTIDTPMLLHSAMKPLIGLQLAMYVDRGHVNLDEPMGKYLPGFNSGEDKGLTFRAGHVHATGIHFPWSIAIPRLFYFRTWQDSMIAHRTREWAPGEQHRYGVVGIILSVRALELMTGRNYWHAMERELFEPLGIRNVLPGGTGFSAENLARIGVLLANGGTYGNLEFISKETYRSIVPAPLTPHFPNIGMAYGIGLRDYEDLFGPGSYGHAGGCGTQLVVNPDKHVVFAMVRNERGKDYKQFSADVLEILNLLVEE